MTGPTRKLDDVGAAPSGGGARGAGAPAPNGAKDAALRADPDFAPARDLLRNAAKPRPPTATERAAILAMAAQIGAGPLPPGPKSGGFSGLSSLGAVKAGGIVVFALAVGGAAWFGLTRSSNPPVVPPSNPPVSTSSNMPVEPPSVAVGAPSNMPVEPPSVAVGAPSNMPVEPPSMPVEAPSSMPVASPSQGRGGDSASPEPAKAAGTSASPSPLGGATRPQDAARNVNASPSGTAPSPSTGCPVSAAAGDRSAEGPMLAAAAKALGSSPLVTLACVQALSTIGGPYQLRDEHAFLGFEASRRLGREADAKRYARALLKASPTSAYAAKARAYLGE